MPTMSDERYREFLTADTRTAKLATTRRDGRPHVVPVWFVLDGDDLVTVTAKDSVKGRALLRDGRVAVCVDDDRRPYAFVMIEGATTTRENPRGGVAVVHPQRGPLHGRGQRRALRPAQRRCGNDAGAHHPHQGPQ